MSQRPPAYRGGGDSQPVSAKLQQLRALREALDDEAQNLLLTLRSAVRVARESSDALVVPASSVSPTHTARRGAASRAPLPGSAERDGLRNSIDRLDVAAAAQLNEWQGEGAADRLLPFELERKRRLERADAVARATTAPPPTTPSAAEDDDPAARELRGGGRPASPLEIAEALTRHPPLSVAAAAAQAATAGFSRPAGRREKAASPTAQPSSPTLVYKRLAQNDGDGPGADDPPPSPAAEPATRKFPASLTRLFDGRRYLFLTLFLATWSMLADLTATFGAAAAFNNALPTSNNDNRTSSNATAPPYSTAEPLLLNITATATITATTPDRLDPNPPEGIAQFVVCLFFLLEVVVQCWAYTAGAGTSFFSKPTHVANLAITALDVTVRLVVLTEGRLGPGDALRQANFRNNAKIWRVVNRALTLMSAVLAPSPAAVDADAPGKHSALRRAGNATPLKPGRATSHWDLALVFPIDEDQDQLVSAEALNVLRAVWRGGLDFTAYRGGKRRFPRYRRSGGDGDTVSSAGSGAGDGGGHLFVKVGASTHRIARYAEETEFPLLLDPDVLGAVCADAGSTVPHVPLMCSRRPYECIYAPYDPKHAPLYAPATAESLDHPFRNAIRCELLVRLLQDDVATAGGGGGGGCGLHLERLKAAGVLLAAFPMTRPESISDLNRVWLNRLLVRPRDIPIGALRSYMGERVAMYFAFLAHLNGHLVAPSVAGVFFFAYQVCLRVFYSRSGGSPIFSIFISLWTVLLLETWKRQQARLALEWGRGGFEATEPDRPSYAGTVVQSPIDGAPLVWADPVHRRQRIAFSVAAVFTCICMVIMVILSIFLFRWALTVRTGTHMGPNLAGSFLNAAQISVTDGIYRRLAVRLTEAENPRTETIFEDSLILKLFCFMSVNSYGSFYYIAFLRYHIEGFCPPVDCMMALAMNLTIIFVLRLFLDNLVELAGPLMARLMKEQKQDHGRTGLKALKAIAGAAVGATSKTKGGPPASSTKAPSSVAERDFAKPEYLTKDGVADYAEMAILFGFVTLFVTALPLTPLIALLATSVEIKGDATKLVKLYRRPTPKGMEDIGSWLAVFQALSAMTVVTNAGLAFFTMDLLLDLPYSTRLWGFLLTQYAIFAAQCALMAIVDDVPGDVSVQMERQAHFRARLVEDGEFAGKAGAAGTTAATGAQGGGAPGAHVDHGDDEQAEFWERLDLLGGSAGCASEQPLGGSAGLGRNRSGK